MDDNIQLGQETDRTRAQPLELPKLKTHIGGVDDVLHGGIAAERLTLISGGPGTGKSLIGLEFLYRGALAGDPGIFVTFEEQADVVRQNALTFGWDLAALEQDDMFYLLEANVDPTVVLSGDFNLKALLAILDGEAERIGAERIVIDAIDVLLRLFNDLARERQELYLLHAWLRQHKLTSFMTVKTPIQSNTPSRYEFLDFMADCVIHLDQRTTEQVSTRRLRVIKYRGSSFDRNEHPYVIMENGISLIPISNIELQHKALGAKLSTGQPDLDALMNGGYRRASCILISGASGTGKTTLVSTFIRAAYARGETVLFIGFEESQAALVSSMLSPGIDLRPALEAGTLQMLTTMPEAVGVEEHLVRAFDALTTFQPDHVVVDAISAVRRMGTERAAFDYVMRLVNACKERGITCLLTNQASGFKATHEFSGMGLSSIVDTLILLQYVEAPDAIHRTLLIVKSRGSSHSNHYHEFRITDEGLDILADFWTERGEGVENG